MNWKNAALLSVFSMLLLACGKSANEGKTASDFAPIPTPPEPVPEIMSVTPDKLAYQQLVTLTVVGKHLDKGVTLTSTVCDGAKKLTGGTATKLTFTCTPNMPGAMELKFALAGVATPYLSNQTVPLPKVKLVTSKGEIEMELYPVNAPLSVKNFLRYVDEKFYTNLIFHRVINNFMIQGGGFDASLVQKTTHDPIKLESVNGLKNLAYTVAMARTSVADSATAQFFINVQDNAFLDGKTAGVDGYAVFGKVTSGQNTVDAIKVVTTKTDTSTGMSDVPVTPITITEATRIQ